MNYLKFTSRASDKTIFYILTLGFCVLPLFKSLTWITTLVITPGCLLFLLAKYKINKNYFNYFVKNFFFLFVIGLLLLVVSYDLDLFVFEMKRLLGVFLAVLLCAIYINSNPSNLWRIYFIIFFKLLMMILFSYFIGIDYSFEQRIVTGKLYGINANYYSYFFFVSLFIFGLVLTLKQSRIIYLLFFLVLIFGILTAILTSSRAGLVFTILSFLLIFLALLRGQRTASRIISIILIIFLAYLILQNIDSSVFIFRRFETFLDSFQDQRLDILNYSIEFIQNNPFGNGPGQFMSLMLESNFSKQAMPHNSFVLAAVNYGFFGLILYLSLFLFFIRDSFKLISKRKKLLKTYGYIFLIFITLFIFYNLFYDFILDMYIMLIFSTFYLHQKIILKGYIPLINI